MLAYVIAVIVVFTIWCIKDYFGNDVLLDHSTTSVPHLKSGFKLASFNAGNDERAIKAQLHLKFALQRNYFSSHEWLQTLFDDLIGPTFSG